jgi:hypothetical protein
MAATTHARRNRRSEEIHQRISTLKHNMPLIEPICANFFFVKKKDGKLQPV